MTIVSPLSTVHTPAGFTAADFLTTMHGQFAVSTKFAVDVIASGGVTNGFTVRSLTDVGPRYIFRRLAAQTVAVSFQPSGGCSDVGDTSTPPTVGTPAIWSGEKTWTFSGSAGTIVLMSELDDAFFVMVTSPARTSFTESCMIGRIIDIDDAGDIALGRDGLGLAVGLPVYSSASAGAYWVNTSSASTGRYNIVRLATNTYGSYEGNLSGNAGYAGFVRPAKRTGAVNITGATSGIGQAQSMSLKYWRVAPQSEPPRTVMFTDPSSNQGWMHVNHVTSATTAVIPWDRTVVPDV